MKRKATSNIRRALILLVISSVVPTVVGMTPRYHGRKEFLPYTRKLPSIDKIELLKLELKDQRWDGEISGTRVLERSEAQKVASLWRRQTYTSNDSACHEPAYAIKFYYRGKLIAYATVCWACDTIFFITPDLQRTQTFAGGDKKGEELSEIFRLAFG